MSGLFYSTAGKYLNIRTKKLALSKNHAPKGWSPVNAVGVAGRPGFSQTPTLRELIMRVLKERPPTRVFAESTRLRRTKGLFKACNPQHPSALKLRQYPKTKLAAKNYLAGGVFASSVRM
jgi:hypothetical protein